MFKVTYIDYQHGDKRYPNTISDGDKFFTYGFGSIYARKFKKYNPDIIVECWKADSRIKDIYRKNIEEVNYIIFPSIKFGKLGHYSFKLIKHLRKELKTGNKVIFNVSSIRHLLFYSIALQLKNHPMVVQHHGEASAIFKSRINNGLKKLYYALQIPIEKIAFKNLDLFSILDERIKGYLPKKNKNLKVEISTTGVDGEIFYPIDKIEAKKLLGWDINKKHILYVGRLNYTKRTDLLIDIYKGLKKELTNAQLIIAGTEETDPLQKMANDAGIIVYGKILQTELYKYLSAADIYVLPKYKKDMPFLGIGMLPVQAMLCNTPVVGESLRNYSGPSISDVGIFVDNYEDIKGAIIKIIRNEIEYKNLRNTALGIYSWKNINEYTRLRYDNLIKEYN